MIIDCIADLHGYEPRLPGGDLLILAGDYTASNKMFQWSSFFNWLKRQPYKNKILIAGNHDGFFESGFPTNQQEADDVKEVQSFLKQQKEMGDPHFEYLCDSGTELITGRNRLKIWGTPWTPLFYGVNPRCKAFMQDEDFLDGKFSLIPEDIDILITHGPMLHLLDSNQHGSSCGSASLRKHIDRVSPRFHVFGHLHEQGNNQMVYNQNSKKTWCVNCSYVDESYRPVFGHVRIEI